MKTLIYFLVITAGFVTHAAINQNKPNNSDCSARQSGPIWQTSQYNAKSNKPAPAETRSVTRTKTQGS